MSLKWDDGANGAVLGINGVCATFRQHRVLHDPQSAIHDPKSRIPCPAFLARANVDENGMEVGADGPISIGRLNRQGSKIRDGVNRPRW